MSYSPINDLSKVFPEKSSIDQVADVLAYLTSYKIELDREIDLKIGEYGQPEEIGKETLNLVQEVCNVKKKSKKVYKSISNMTQSIQEFDNCKNNLVLSMTVLKRLQMLIDAYNNLRKVLPKKSYKDIHEMLSVVKDLLNFFRPYRSINEINKFNLELARTENKLVDDIFIDFEDTVVNDNYVEELVHGCEILSLIDLKYKDRLLNWFYNIELRDIKAIFNISDEAGSLDNLERRYIYFNNVLSNVHQKYKQLFPVDWKVDLELSKIFCTLTKQDLYSQLNPNILPAKLLNCLSKTLEFENNLNRIFDSSEFSRLISAAFEPYLPVWVKDQEKTLSSKISESFSTSQLPEEYRKVSNYEEFMSVLKVNSVPNIANSSVELFKTYQKVFNAAAKLSNGNILVELSKLFVKYLFEYNKRVLTPLIPESKEHLVGVEPMKHLTMVLNTADFILNNINDLEDRFKRDIDESLQSKIDYNASRDSYIDLVSITINALLRKFSVDLELPWRQFRNNNWKNLEHTFEVSTYMADMEKAITEDCKIIFSLIIREGYSHNFCDKLVVLIADSFMYNIKNVTPLNIMSAEQMMNDIDYLKSIILKLRNYSNANYENSSESNIQSEKHVNSYTRHVNNQFSKVEKVLKLIVVPTLPVDNLVFKYFEIVGDRSPANFCKILSLKGVDKVHIEQYLEVFKKKVEYQSSLPEESGILSALYSESDVPTPHKTPTSPKISDLDPRSARIWNNNFQINTLEKNLKDLAVSGENQVHKIKNFGKFFRKDAQGE